jgi:hypothetical protein
MRASRRRLRSCVIGFALVLVAGFSAHALADGDDDDCDGDEDGEDCAGGSPGEVKDAVSYRAPCWITNVAGPSGYKELIVGRMWGKRSTAGDENDPESYFDGVGSDCGLNDIVTSSTGHITTTFFVRLSSWYAQKSTSSASTATITEEFAANYHTTANCGGSSTSLGTTKSWTETFTTSELNWEEADRFDTSAGSTGRGFVLPAGALPGANTVYSIDFTLTVTVDGSAVSTGTSCFNYRG